mmetsp:Transcript_42370/g.130786  ORF Transcript_42370/g.130786 Transcript_42370/m.130786 type:complete len:277 (+) Transcript_42370:41-871(+)
MFVFRTTTPGRAVLSMKMTKAYQSRATSRLTRIEIGMIDDSRIWNREKLMMARPIERFAIWNCCTTRRTDRAISSRKHSSEIQLSSASMSPRFGGACSMFIAERVSTPVYTTAPMTLPLATVQLHHSALLTLRPSASWPAQKTRPSNLSMAFDGGSHSTLMRWHAICSGRMSRVALVGYRSFQSVSPSSWSVRTKHAPLDSEVHRSARSAGMRWPECTRKSMPILMSRAATSSTVPSGLRCSYTSELILRSWIQRLMSSKASLASERPTTKASGAK